MLCSRLKRFTNGMYRPTLRGTWATCDLVFGSQQWSPGPFERGHHQASSWAYDINPPMINSSTLWIKTVCKTTASLAQSHTACHKKASHITKRLEPTGATIPISSSVKQLKNPSFGLTTMLWGRHGHLEHGPLQFSFPHRELPGFEILSCGHQIGSVRWHEKGQNPQSEVLWPDIVHVTGGRHPNPSKQQTNLQKDVNEVLKNLLPEAESQIIRPHWKPRSIGVFWQPIPQAFLGH